MKRINPFSEKFQKIRKIREDNRLKRMYKHEFNCKREMDFDDFQDCWWSYKVCHNSINYYLSPNAIWGRYNNQLALEVYNIDEDLKYLEELPEDYKDQNNIIEEFNKFIEYEMFHKENYWHFYLCEFK